MSCPIPLDSYGKETVSPPEVAPSTTKVADRRLPRSHRMSCKLVKRNAQSFQVSARVVSDTAHIEKKAPQSCGFSRRPPPPTTRAVSSRPERRDPQLSLTYRSADIVPPDMPAVLQQPIRAVRSP